MSWHVIVDVHCDDQVHRMCSDVVHAFCDVPQDQHSQDSANEQEQAPILTGTSLWLMSPDNWLRNLLSQLVRHRAFENGIVFIIIVSSITLAMDSPGLDPESPLKQVCWVQRRWFAS